jgi:hypothetical protein
VQAPIEAYAQPATVAHVRRDEETLGIGVDEHGLHSSRRRAPDREPPVAVVICHHHQKRLFATHEESRRAVAEPLAGLRQPEADLPDPLERPLTVGFGHDESILSQKAAAADSGEMINAEFPWRPLGTLLVDQGLLTSTELELALAEQARTGRLLGQIMVDHGYVSAFSLARVLSEQHGVQLRPGLELVPEEPNPATPAHEPNEADAWRPLGKVLVENGYLTKTELDNALEVQRERGGRLGEILVARGSMTPPTLARALAEQHGVELATGDQTEAEGETGPQPAGPWDSVYQVCEIGFRPGYQTRSVLYENQNFLECADYAYEFVHEHEPAAVEILRTAAETSEVVWTYNASRAAALEAARTSLVDTFGFDPITWGNDSP